MRRPDNLDRARAACATREVVDQFYTLLDGTLEALGLKDKPSQIYNCDQTGFAMERGREKVLALEALNMSTRQSRGTREHVSKAGHIDGELFRKWFQHFIRHAVPERPLLIFDGHKSHLDLERVSTNTSTWREWRRRGPETLSGRDEQPSKDRERWRGAAVEETIEAVIAGVGTTTSDSGNTISPSLCDSPRAPAAEAGHLPLPPPIPSAILQPPAKPSAAAPAVPASCPPHSPNTICPVT
ncbi:hypothetical protein SKAU_G00089940 [Synaphobranchus kaupii]|uniref:Uncharacterized protein n=1 Tax=Synaphobranchus kaupii TaxID=118154 RepID=A0A9Q1FWG7_SYNKA|nr:hypothetical protein SKAU_G00089940 [Synaphobranchus kaupii]